MFLDKIKIIVYIIYHRVYKFKAKLLNFAKNYIILCKEEKMGKTVAIICEYNPFHNGHSYQIQRIREIIPDATVVCIMSGNIVQRGDFAFLDKYARAKSAVICGANAVLEIPYPYSASNAEIFALAGVEIANHMGADFLCFGSESNDLENLSKIAKVVDSEEFERRLQKELLNKKESYLSSKQKALEAFGMELPKDSNDMLAVEYLRAISKINSKIKPLPIKREGEGYKETGKLSDMMSATGIRNYFYSENKLNSVPKRAHEIFDEEIRNGAYVGIDKAQQFLYMNILTATAEKIEKTFDASSGMGYFILETARNSASAKDFFEKMTSKNYTHSRLKRVITYFAFGVEKVERAISFANLLCADKVGRGLIKAKKKDDFKIITKTADSKSLDDKSKELYMLGKKVDEVYFSLLSTSKLPSDVYKQNAIVI